MNTKLDNITTQYRKFNANQALTEGQLNEFIDYFEDQDRLSRTRLDGVGIVCGLETMLTVMSGRDLVTLPMDQRNQGFLYITVNQGAGVTTDGDLVTLRNRDYKSKESSIDLKTKNYKYFRAFTDGYRYPHFFKSNVQMPLLELFTEDEYDYKIDNGADSTTFFDVNLIPELENKIVILYLESYSNDESPCEDADCDNNGAEQVSELKVLLANRELVDEYILNGEKKDDIYNLHNSYEVLYNELKDIEAPRVILNTGITTELAVRAKFQGAIQSPTIVTDLSEGFKAIAETFGINMGLSGQTLESKLNQLLSTTPDDYQYRYDLLKDLIDTYNEIRGLVLHLKSVCCPSISSFSKHLLLGPIGASLELGSQTPFRHDFYHSPINTNQDENRERLLQLASRFAQTIKDFQTFNGPVKIIPSYLNTVLGQRAVPFYYRSNSDLLKKWNFEKTKVGKETYNLSYHTGNLANVDFVQNPLLYNIDDNDFYRIEGHLRKPYTIALQNINDLKEKYGLAFDVIALVLQKSKTTGGIKPLAVSEPSTISIKDLRQRLVSISSDVSNQVLDTKRTLQAISGLDNQLKLLNAVEFAAAQPLVSVVRQDPKENKVVSELLSEFLERKTGLEHLSGVERGGTFCLIYESEENNEVIADFSLPYLCCSKKDPVFLVLPATKLCQNDVKVPITILPLDGEVKAYVGTTQITAVTQSGGQNFFNPGLVSSQYFGQTITFSVNDDPVDSEMIVYAQPNVTVTAGEPVYGEDPDVPEATVQFSINGNVTGLTYSINFGDGKSASGAVPAGGKISHTYSLVVGRKDTFRPIVTITNPNNCSKQHNLAPISLEGQSTVRCLSSMEVIVQYNERLGPCPGGHTCNSAKFNLMANGVNIGLVSLNNVSETLEAGQARPNGETSGRNRINSFFITPQQAQTIVAANIPNDGFISFSLVCAAGSCHSGVAWTTLKLDGAVIYNGCPTNNFLTINPCTGVIR